MRHLGRTEVLPIIRLKRKNGRKVLQLNEEELLGIWLTGAIVTTGNDKEENQGNHQYSVSSMVLEVKGTADRHVEPMK